VLGGASALCHLDGRGADRRAGLGKAIPQEQNVGIITTAMIPTVTESHSTACAVFVPLMLNKTWKATPGHDASGERHAVCQGDADEHCRDHLQGLVSACPMGLASCSVRM
jgi:hypothetical protein